MKSNWQIGDRIEDRWQVYGILKGGMGVVYVVYDHKLREAFAAKTFQDEMFALNPKFAGRFTREARAWINLDAHQNIAQARFVEVIEGKPYLFLEFVSGGDLGKWIGTSLLTSDLPQVVRFAIQFCDGMTHVLSKGIKAHRDIKPPNCLITVDKTLKITDFGLVKVSDSAGSELIDVRTPNVGVLTSDVSGTGAAVGTQTHMAPEQFDDAKHIDVRADIYSFGVMLFQMAVGELPFVGPTWKDFELQHKNQAPPLIKVLNLELRAVIETCLAKDPSHRFADFREIRDQLADIYEGLTGERASSPIVGAALGAAQLNNKGVSLHMLGLSAESIACYDAALELNRNFDLPFLNKGSALGKLNHNEESILCYDQALEINPASVDALTGKAAALLALKRHEDAVDCCNRAIELDPKYAVAWSNKGAALGDRGDLSEALNCFEEAQRLGSKTAAQGIAECRRRLLARSS